MTSLVRLYAGDLQYMVLHFFISASVCSTGCCQCGAFTGSRRARAHLNG